MRARGERVAFVPTMGALHAGHLSLVERARRSADRVIVSIFVNPLQFGPHEDFRRYPRPVARDRALLTTAGVDLLWEPAVTDLYPPHDRTRVSVAGLSDVLEGASRPGHYTGVCTVVARLLGAVQPDVMWLGQKDAQQALILERMAADLLMPVRIRRGDTMREPDGLAMSSRNAYLSASERQQAVALSQGLVAARMLLRAGSGARRDSSPPSAANGRAIRSCARTTSPWWTRTRSRRSRRCVTPRSWRSPPRWARRV
jgi:pantoate--beta-alanine ligase